MAGGIGGRRYQIAAVILTYAAVSMSAIPIGISQYMKDKKTKPPTRQVSAPPSNAPSAATPSTPVQSEDVTSDDAASSATAGAKQKPGLGVALVGLALLGLASPFLELQDPVHGIIGLVILWVGISIAWRLTAAPKIDILGPFSVGVSSPPPPLG